ncbi:MAG: filamentation induced by cAMP protein Fic [uncultured bacterium (gcode 4)]|uniref:Filamentation induced by cAMP protein Fic n=1 Tax=uncultured bacterium (gcode 4) TaxID=1234023 RepID=K2AX70_9BACT|nr:MAG: filamentation induced by cAMP protein Fic [uncultured bacterium (gcode 4)]
MFDKTIPYNDLPLLPWDFDFDKKEFLKLAIKASEEISKLNWLSYLIPNIEILVSPLLIKESVESSAIENINTTTLKVLQSNALSLDSIKWPEKEVLHYHNAILKWFERLKKEGGIWFNFLVELQGLIEPQKTWIRKIPWTVIANNMWEILYTPPVWEDNIIRLLTNLEKFINNSSDDIDALIKMPVIHYQFESIHPFFDWNGRTWRILNILYLVLTKKLDYPILFLSEYINKTRQQYYQLLSYTTSSWDYSKIIVYLLEWMIFQAKSTSDKIIKIRNLMDKIEQRLSILKVDYHKITNILFSNPFLTIKEFEKLLWVARITATRQIKKLEEQKIISSMKIWKNKLIFIQDFINLLI